MSRHEVVELSLMAWFWQQWLARVGDWGRKKTRKISWCPCIQNMEASPHFICQGARLKPAMWMKKYVMWQYQKSCGDKRTKLELKTAQEACLCIAHLPLTSVWCWTQPLRKPQIPHLLIRRVRLDYFWDPFWLNSLECNTYYSSVELF